MNQANVKVAISKREQQLLRALENIDQALESTFIRINQRDIKLNNYFKPDLDQDLIIPTCQLSFEDLVN